MSIARNQARIAGDLWHRLQPLDRNTPSRLQALLADRRFGSRDRRLYRELLITALRHARAIAGLQDDDWAAYLARVCDATPETAAFREAYVAGAQVGELHPPAPAPLDLLPAWFADECDTGETAATTAAALLGRAPLWVRLQTDDPEAVLAEWASRGWTASPHPALPGAWRLPSDTAVTSCDSYHAGHYEVQDLGSQLILASLGLAPAATPVRWLDACAGAGGKTLQLARLLGPAARIEAADIRPAALAELRARATRAGLKNIHTVTRPSGLYDGVLVDAPCSGSGTWRRSPHLMACTTPADLDAAATLQSRLLAEAAPLVLPGGLLVYATCSIARRENRAVAAAFLAAQSGTFRTEPPVRTFGFPVLSPDPGLVLTPGREDNDGFYVAAFRRASAAAAL